jgi:hypothetical protein
MNKKNDNHLNGFEVVPHCGFDLHFPTDIKQFFLCLLVISSLEKCLFKSIAHFLVEWFVF